MSTEMEINDLEDLPTAWSGHRNFAIWLVEHIQPRVTIDLGVDYGYSLFCLATPRIGKVYGIDSFESDLHAGDHPDNYDSVIRFKEKHNFDNVHLIKGRFSEVCKTWEDSIQILHIDGLHTYEAITEDWNNWSPFVEDSGVILMHDLFSFHETVGRFYNEIDSPKAYFEESAGLGVITKDEKLLKTILDNFSRCRPPGLPVRLNNMNRAYPPGNSAILQSRHIKQFSTPAGLRQGTGCANAFSPYESTSAIKHAYMNVYVVFHNTISPGMYDELDENEKNTITLYGVKKRRETGIKTVYEDELPIYNPRLQMNNYNEGSALYHVYMNNLAKTCEYIGFFQYDMKFCKNAINTAKNIAMHAPATNNIFFIDFFDGAFFGGQTAIVRDYADHKLISGLESYNKYFGTRYSPEVLVATRMIICNSFIIPARLYEKMMGWMKAYFIDEISVDLYDQVNELHFNPGHMIEGLTGMFLSLEVAQGAVYHRIPVVNHL